MNFSPHGKREIFAVFMVSIALAAICLKYLPYATPVPFLLLLFTLYFFRDPERTIPDREHIMVAPADGKITDIQEVSCPDLDNETCLRIGIFLSVFNVHVNRSPCSGTVTNIQYREGQFHNAMSEKASEKNESNTVLIENDETAVAVKQIAGLIARRIRCDVEEGDRIERGERIGMIKFGSRTELYIPLSSEPESTVDVGDSVRGGASILVQLSSSDNSRKHATGKRNRKKRTARER